LLLEINHSLSEANNVVSAIAQADFSQRMTGNYSGDLDRLKTGVNASANSVSFMIDELSKVMQGLNQGRFDLRMDTRVPQAFRELVEGALNRLDHVVKDINLVMTKMNAGDFNARVHGEAHGELQHLKTAVNDSMTSLSTAVSAVVTLAQALAKGDLTARVEGRYQGDLASIQAAMNAAVTSLNQSFSSVKMQSGEVRASASQVSDANGALSSRIQQQAAALEETASAMEELTAQVHNAAQSSQSAAQLAHHSASDVRAGSIIMNEAITSMNDIREVSQRITGIVSLIDSIAFQTNLLALNAAVEAARAGEHGRGFAVVASEVRALAGKSADAAKDIKGLIDQTAEKINQGTEKVQATGAMLNGILTKFDQMAGLVSQISDNSREQALGIEQSNQAISEIDRAVQQGAAVVLENAALANYLGEVAGSLDQLVSHFKLDASQVARQASVEDMSLPSALVVDDNIPSQKLAVSLLKANGYRVDAVSSGRQAIALANQDYELVLMDIQMADGNGLDAMRSMRERGSRSKIFAVSAEKSYEQQALQSGADGFVLKPLRPENVRQLLSSRPTLLRLT
jgi:methyl-accepting chemotaxis protein